MSAYTGKPGWKDAPEWARYLAMDEHGDWYWYEKKPERLNTCWSGCGGKAEIAARHVGDWAQLEARPMKQIEVWTVFNTISGNCWAFSSEEGTFWDCRHKYGQDDHTHVIVINKQTVEILL